MNTFKNIVVTAVATIMLTGCGDTSQPEVKQVKADDNHVNIGSLSSEFQPHVTRVLSRIEYISSPTPAALNISAINDLSRKITSTMETLRRKHPTCINEYTDKIRSLVIARSKSIAYDKFYSHKDVKALSIAEVTRILGEKTYAKLADSRNYCILNEDENSLDLIHKMSDDLISYTEVVYTRDKTELDREVDARNKEEELISGYDAFSDFDRSVSDAGSLIVLTEDELGVIKDTKAVYKALMCPVVGDCKALNNIELRVIGAYYTKYKPVQIETTETSEENSSVNVDTETSEENSSVNVDTGSKEAEQKKEMIDATAKVTKSYPKCMSKYTTVVKEHIVTRSADGVHDKVYTLGDLDGLNILELVDLSHWRAIGHMDDTLYTCIGDGDDSVVASMFEARFVLGHTLSGLE